MKNLFVQSSNKLVWWSTLIDFAALPRSSGMQWSFSNKVSALPQFLSFKAPQEGGSRKTVHDTSAFMTISTADAFHFSQKPFSGVIQVFLLLLSESLFLLSLTNKALFSKKVKLSEIIRNLVSVFWTREKYSYLSVLLKKHKWNLNPFFDLKLLWRRLLFSAYVLVLYDLDLPTSFAQFFYFVEKFHSW